MTMMRMVTAGGRWVPGRLPACARLWPVAGAGNDVRTFVLHGVDVSVLPLAADVAYGDVVDEESLVAAFDGYAPGFHPPDTSGGRRSSAKGKKGSSRREELFGK
ncbi:hypothetical protein C2845_PM04G20470 [Panicum miliaceum]|uniref:Uncharacterized protein n=1 Tax=Panicum miliaceum TaxID=4540 RepID=A0A3L6QRV6_PANMI|nr:hypothetical protein C2845_PM04G20470 [Panicum miliaceum]